MKLVTVAEMLEIESEADASGLTYDRMMENAGSGLAEVIRARYVDLQEPGALGMVGPGNNGGDTLVALSQLAEEGWRATAYLIKSRPKDDPLVDRLREAGGEVLLAEDDSDFETLAQQAAEHDLLLDGVLGTGVELPLRGVIAEALAAARQALDDLGERAPQVIAVDCPSGVDTDAGEVAPETIPADVTVTMAAVKQGMVKFPAFTRVGDLELVEIGLPDDLPPWEAIRRRVADADWVRACLPERPLDAHKGTFGTALIVAGSVNFTGAATLTAEAAYRVGAGLVTVAAPAPLHGVLAGTLPEATWLLLPHEIGVISPNAVEVIQKHLQGVSAMALGPGLGQEEATEGFVARLLGAERGKGRGPGIGFVRSGETPEEHPRADLPPLVVDADGLKLLARVSDWPKWLPEGTVLTPHPGEMAVMTGEDKDALQSDRMSSAARFAEQWEAVVVLKGALTVVAAADGRLAVVPVATPALARAGTGDVLTGLIAGLRAQGVEPYEAAVAGAWIHAQAGLHAADVIGNTAAVLAGDVLLAVVDVLSALNR